MEHELLTLLKQQIERYPAMQIQDCVKFLYQHIMGNEHMVLSEDKCLEMLIKEKEAIGCNSNCYSYDVISNNSCRFNLLPLDNDKAALTTLSKLFIKSAKTLSGNIQSQKDKLTVAISLLLNWCREGILPFPFAEVECFLKEYIQSEYPAVHHSQVFRDTYHPAYRLIRTDFARYFSLFVAIDRLLKEKPYVVIAIDGKCGAGKSTLAALLMEVYPSNLIHMDDFYLPAHLRTADRLAQSGGNIHYERFNAQIMPALITLKNASYNSHIDFTNCTYQIFDCHKMDYKEQPSTITTQPLTIIEGSYSMRPEFRDAYDLKVFLDIAPELQKKRLLARNGAEAYKHFETKWIPMELKYFDSYQISSYCDLIY